MTTRLLVTLLVTLLPALPLAAQDRQTLGWGRLFDNDAMGDMHDRWHTGSYTLSMLRGPGWTGDLPSGLGTIMEYRFSGGLISAGDLTNPDPDDRRYAGPLSIGAHSHLSWRGFDATLGADLVAIGPQTGMGRFHTWIHEVLDVGTPDLSNELGNALYPTLRGELGRDLALSDRVTLHPFLAAQAGIETMVRAGGDIVIGSFGQGGLLLRDETTGQRYRGIQGGEGPGLSFTLGGDIAHVFDSAYLPEGGAVTAADTRTRLRAGVNWQGERASVFYGVTYLGPEFDSQPEGQLVGSLNLNLRF
jgi:Uncharacterized protein conserved in bacteria (DUF2219)